MTTGHTRDTLLFSANRYALGKAAGAPRVGLTGTLGDSKLPEVHKRTKILS